MNTRFANAFFALAASIHRSFRFGSWRVSSTAITLAIVLFTNYGYSQETPSPTESPTNSNATDESSIGEFVKPLFQRLFVPEEQVGKLVPRDYMPITVNDLEMLLTAADLGGAASWEAIPTLDQATYFAEMKDDSLISDYSIWNIRYLNDLSGYLFSNPLNLAIQDANDVDLSELLPDFEKANWRVDNQQRLWLPVNGSGRFIFGWRLPVSEELNGARNIDFQTPPANINRLFLKLDSRWVLRCEQGVVTRITSPTESPSDSEDDLEKVITQWITRNTSDGKSLWKIDFSGTKRLQLQLHSSEASSSESLLNVFASSLHQYRIHNSGIDLTTRLGIFNTSTSIQLRFDVTPPLKIRDIRLEGNPLKWSKVVGSPNTIEISPFSIPTTSRIGQIQINAYAPWEHGRSMPLPGIDFPSGKILRGETILESVKPILPISMTVAGGEPIKVIDEQSTNQGLNRWQWRWSGSPASIQLETTKVQAAVQANSLTRLNLVNGSIAATSLIRISPTLKSAGKATLELGEGWIVDAVAPLQSSSLKVDEVGDKDRTQILLRWEEYTSDELLSVEIQLHRAIETIGAETRLAEAPFISLAEGYHRGVLAIETTGRYLLKPTPDLLNVRIEEAELTTWQKDRLPRFSNLWLLKAENGRHPELIFTSEPSTYTSTSEVRVSPHPGGLQEEYRLMFRPLFGSMDRVSVRLKHAHKNPLLWRWQDGDQQYALQATRDATDNPADGESYVIFLPQPMTEPFELRSNSLIEAADWYPVAWATSDQATNEENHVLLADSLASQIPKSGWRAMVSQSMNDVLFKSFRAESNLAENILCKPQDRRSSAAAWALRAQHQHWHYSSGVVVHQSTWYLENTSNSQVELILPKEHEILEVQFDKNIIQSFKTEKDSQSFLIDLPSSNNRGRLQVLYRNNAAPLSWRLMADYQAATLALPCLEENEFLFLPQLYSPLNAEAFLGPTGSLAVRDAGLLLWHLIVNLTGNEEVRPGLGDGGSVSQLLQSELPLPDDSTWNSFRLSRSSSDRSRSPWTSIWDVRVLTVWILGSCCVLFLLSLWLWRRYPRMIACVTFALILLSTVLPSPFAVMGAVPIIPLAIALLVALAAYSLKANSSPSQSPSVRASFTAFRNALPLILLLLLPLTFLSSSLLGSRIAFGQEPQTYGILIPYADSGELKGNYVYVPMEAYNVLNSFGGRSISPNSTYLFRNASYQLRITDDMNSMSGTEYQLIADYELEITDASVPITWPISSNDAKLERLIVNQFEIIPGFTVRQDENSIRWLPERNGLTRVRLQLAPKITAANQLEQFTLAIPVIPSATLSVTGSSGRKFNLQDAIVDNPLTNSTLLHLGSMDRLRFSMQIKEAEEDANRFDSELDSWLHFQGKEALLLTQMRIRIGDLAAPQELTIQMDDRWQPCGRQWGDGRWIGLPQSTETRGISEYKVKLESFSMAESKLSIVWVPRGQWISEDVAPPLFPDSPSLNTTLYTFTTSGSSDALWTTEVSDAWTPEAADRAIVRWEGNGLSLPNRSYTNASKTPLPTFVRQTKPERAAIAESCSSSIHRRLISMSYEASWNASGPTGDILQFALPAQSTIESVVFNGSKLSEYDVVDIGKDSRLILNLQDTNPRPVNNLQIQATTILAGTFPQSVPRITAIQTDLNQSYFSLYREANLAVTLENVEELPETRLPLERIPQQMLREQRIGILSLDLTNRYRNSPTLPLQFSYASPSSGLSGITLGRLIQFDNKWRYSLIASLSSSGEPIDSLVFELPASIPADIKTFPPTPFRLDPSPDGSHQLLSVYPDTPITSTTQLEIQFELTKSANQVALPQAALLGTDRVESWIALPQVGNTGDSTWRTAGLKPSPPSAEVLALLQRHSEEVSATSNEAWQFFEPINRRFQADLESGKSSAQAIKVALAEHHLTLRENKSMMGRFSYLLHPEGFMTANFEIPEGANLLGIVVGGVPQATSQKSDSAVEVPLQPSDLPVIVELYLQYDAANESPRNRILVPKPLNMAVATSSLAIHGLASAGLRLDDTLFELDGVTVGVVSSADLSSARWQALSGLLIANRDQINSLPAASFESWSAPWIDFATRLTKQSGMAPQNEELAQLLKLAGKELAADSDEVSKDMEDTKSQATFTSLEPKGFFLKEGPLNEVTLSGTQEPFQVPFSWIVACGGFLLFLFGLSRGKTTMRNVAVWLSSQPATVLYAVAILLLAITRIPSLSIGLAIAATISLGLQSLYRITGNRTSRNALSIVRGKSVR
jgi:hypothetical protein